MKIYESQHYEYVQNMNKSLKIIRKKYVQSNFSNERQSVHEQHVAQTGKWQNNKPLCYQQSVKLTARDTNKP